MTESSFALLDALADGADAGLADLAAATELPEATTHGLLDKLVARGVVWHKGGRYRIASRMASFGQAWRPAAVLRVAAQQPVRELAAATQQASVVVALPTEAETVVVAGFAGEVHEVLPLRAGFVFPPGNGLDVLLAAEARARRRRRPATPNGSGRGWLPSPASWALPFCTGILAARVV